MRVHLTSTLYLACFLCCLWGFQVRPRSVLGLRRFHGVYNGPANPLTKMFSTPPARPSSKRKLTWEEKHQSDPLKSDYPTVDVHPRVDAFTKWFVGYAQIRSLDVRSQAWIPHMQWARRTVLAQGLRDVGQASSAVVPGAMVEAEYTLLSNDRLGPVGQLVVLRANASDAVLNELRDEPLQATSAIAPWRVFELQLEQNNCDPLMEQEERDFVVDSLSTDLHNPYIFLSIAKPSSGAGVPSQAGHDEGSDSSITAVRAQALDASLRYHLKCAQNNTALFQDGGEAFLPLYANASRVAMLGRLVDLNSPGEVAGQLLLFNARSRADALRYLKRDPVAAAVGATPAPFDAVTLAAVNVQDVDGLHHVMARSFAEKEAFDQLHFMDPEDLLLKDEVSSRSIRPGAETVATPPGHFERNRQLLVALAEHGVSYRYTRMPDNDPLRERYLRGSEATTAGTKGDAGTVTPRARRGRPARVQPDVAGLGLGLEAGEEESDGVVESEDTGSVADLVEGVDNE